MKTAFYGLLCILFSLTACTTLPPQPPAPAPAPAPPVLCTLENGLARLNTSADPACPATPVLLLARQVLSNHADLNRLQSQLEILAVQESDPASQNMALLLSGQLAERKRLQQLLDKQIIQTKEQQKRANDLAAKLEALKEMEKTLLERSKKP